MNDLEKILVSAPAPIPPAGLKEQLLKDVRLPGPVGRTPAGWWKRWWPVLLPAAASAACGLVLSLQQAEKEVLEESLRQLPPAKAPPEPVTPAPGGPTAPAVAATPLNAEQELANLRQTRDRLASEVAALQDFQTRNAQLRENIARASANTIPPEELQVLAETRDRAASINCINNLKQLGLAAKFWAVDHGDLTPATLLAMTNEMGTPKILCCPGDAGREPAKDWASFSPSNLSYTYLLPSTDDSDPYAVLFMCPVHGHIGLMDGSVHGGVAKERPSALQQRDGKLIYTPGGGLKAAPLPTAPAPSP